MRKPLLVVEAQMIHRVRKMVAKLNHVTVSQFAHSLICEGYRDACHDILEQLDAMTGKGKP